MENHEMKPFFTLQRAEKSFCSAGNTTRLHRAFKKAESGEQVTIAYIGGSITEGSCANPRETHCYAALSAREFAEKYMPDPEKLNFVNAGISATNSVLGVVRATREVLKKQPDIIFVEFAVNDADNILFQRTYESLIRKFLKWEGEAAVILIFNFDHSGWNCQSWMQQIGAHYDLGMVSVRDALYPDMQAGIARWEDYSPDGIHPNTRGHRFIADLIAYYYEQAKKAPASPWQMQEAPLFDNFMEDVMDMGQGHPFIVSEGDFPCSDVWCYSYRRGWQHDKGGNAPFKMHLPGRRLAVAFQRSTDPKFGTAEVWADGEMKMQLEGYTPTLAWGQPVACILEMGEGVHEIEIRMAPGHEDKYFLIPDMGYVE